MFGALAADIYDLVTLFLSVQTFGNSLTYFVKELSFELLVHILLYEEGDDIMIMITVRYSLILLRYC